MDTQKVKATPDEVTKKSPEKAPEVVLPENSAVKIAHAPGTKSEKVVFSSTDIVDNTLAGSNPNLMTNVRERKSVGDKIKEASNRANKRAKADSEKFSKDLKTKSAKVKDFFFGGEHRVVTLSTIAAILVAVALLIIPSLFKVTSSSDNPLAIDPETGLSNRETEWQAFTNMIRTRVYELSESDRTQPQDAVRKYFDELLAAYRGVAQHLDIRSIEAEYYLNLGLNYEALSALESVDPDEYKQPVDTDSDLPAYFDRVLRYYDLLASAETAIGADTIAEEVRVKYNAVYDEYARVRGLPSTAELESSEEGSEDASN